MEKTGFGILKATENANKRRTLVVVLREASYHVKHVGGIGSTVGIGAEHTVLLFVLPKPTRIVACSDFVRNDRFFNLLNKTVDIDADP